MSETLEERIRRIAIGKQDAMISAYASDFVELLDERDKQNCVLTAKNGELALALEAAHEKNSEAKSLLEDAKERVQFSTECAVEDMQVDDCDVLARIIKFLENE